MSVYVGIDVHRKRSRVAVIDQGGEVLANRNVPNGVKPILSVICGLPTAPRPRTRPRSAGGAVVGPGMMVAVDDLARTRLLRRGFLLEYVTLGWNVAGLALTLFICHVGYEVTADELGRLAAGELSRLPPEAGSFTWTTRAAPV